MLALDVHTWRCCAALIAPSCSSIPLHLLMLPLHYEIVLPHVHALKTCSLYCTHNINPAVFDLTQPFLIAFGAVLPACCRTSNCSLAATLPPRSNVDFRVADVTELTLPEGSFDVVFSNWLLMYLSDQEVLALATNILRWVRRAGALRAGRCAQGSGAGIQERPGFVGPPQQVPAQCHVERSSRKGVRIILSPARPQPRAGCSGEQSPDSLTPPPSLHTHAMRPFHSSIPPLPAHSGRRALFPRELLSAEW